MAPGNISQKIEGTVRAIDSRMPAASMSEYTEHTRNFMKSIGEAFQSIYNNFIESWNIFNISVNGGLCTCRITSSGPVSGTYGSGTGILEILEGNGQAIFPVSALYEDRITGNMTGDFYAGGDLEPGVMAHIEAIAFALADTHSLWMASTKIIGLQVSGGFTFPGAPISNAIGNSGIFQ